jgi:hypothetical protein
MDTSISDYAKIAAPNSRESLEAERKFLNDRIDQTLIALRALMNRKIELEMGCRLLYGMNVTEETKNTDGE